MKRFYLYAGYYELHLSAHELPAPFVFISRHKKVARALEAARRYDNEAHIIAYHDTADEIADEQGLEIEQLEIA